MKTPEAITEPCAGPRCDRPARAKGLCPAHYKQAQKHGRLGVLNRYQRRTTPRQEAA